MNFEPDDEVPRLLAQAMPRGAPPEVRRDVLDAVAAELAKVRRRSGTYWLAWGVAALLLVTIGLNVAVNTNEARRMARLMRGRGESAAVAELIETMAASADEASVDRFREYLAAALPRRTAAFAAWPQNELQAIRRVSAD